LRSEKINSEVWIKASKECHYQLCSATRYDERMRRRICSVFGLSNPWSVGKLSIAKNDVIVEMYHAINRVDSFLLPPLEITILAG